jgi:hypothetical protein
MKEITVKIISIPYIKGDDVFCDVQLFGNPKKWTYRMKIGKTLWYSIYDHLQTLDHNRFSEELEPSVINENLEYLNGRIITVRGIPDSKRTFVKKDGNIESPKIFVVDFRSDLEEAETIGGEIYKKAVFDTVLDNISCEDCIIANSNIAKFEIEKVKEKEQKREQKNKDKELKNKEKEQKLINKDKKKTKKEVTIEEEQKKNLEQSSEEWAIRKREDLKKEDKRQKKLEFAGW